MPRDPASFGVSNAGTTVSRLQSFGRSAGLVGAALGAAVAGVAVGLVAEKAAVGRLGRRDLAAGERFGGIRGRPVEVIADDGTLLHVETDGPDDAQLTVVWTHGYALNSDMFHYQRRDLRRPEERFVFWDQRSHGRSVRGHRDRATIDQLGRDLDAVLQAVVPRGPLVLIGHSMGGMTIMALADQRPELFGDRVIGVGLIGTSSGQLNELTLGIPLLDSKLATRFRPGIMAVLGRQHHIIERGRRIGSDVGFLLTKRYAFASDVPPSVVEFAAEMIAATPIDVLAEFYPSLDAHEKVAALAAFNNGVEVLVLLGAEDRLTPVEHSWEIVRNVPGAELIVVPSAGHLVMLEHPGIVNEHLRALIDRSARAADLDSRASA
jgi:pimeloyl-ACP methyl ester carboxylesterase